MGMEETVVDEDQLPLIDRAVMADWSSDLDRDDVLDLLSRVPGESYRCLTAIRQAATDGDLVAAKRAAHCLKGMASNLGATRLARQARSIELMSNDTESVLRQSAVLEQTLIETLAHVQTCV